jgi:cell division septation protein DedD
VAATLLLFGLIVTAGCSKDDDVTELEQEMLSQDAPPTEAAVDSQPVPSRPPDTVASDLDVGAIPEETIDEPEMPPRPVGVGYEVQVAGCEDPAYARYLIDKYRNRGYEPYVTEADVAGQKYYRVRLGVFETLSEAKRIQAELKDRYSIDTWIDAA